MQKAMEALKAAQIEREMAVKEMSVCSVRKEKYICLYSIYIH